MVGEMIDGTYRQTNLRTSHPTTLQSVKSYVYAEIELLRQRERVAELRRALPTGATFKTTNFLKDRLARGRDEPVKNSKVE